MRTVTLTVPEPGERYYACRTASSSRSRASGTYDYTIYIQEYFVKVISFRDKDDPVFQTKIPDEIYAVPEYGPGNFTVKVADKYGGMNTASPLVEGDWSQLVSTQSIAELPVIFFADRDGARAYAEKIREAIYKSYKSVGTVTIT